MTRNHHRERIASDGLADRAGSSGTTKLRSHIPIAHDRAARDIRQHAPDCELETGSLDPRLDGKWFTLQNQGCEALCGGIRMDGFGWGDKRYADQMTLCEIDFHPPEWGMGMAAPRWRGRRGVLLQKMPFDIRNPLCCRLHRPSGCHPLTLVGHRILARVVRP